MENNLISDKQYLFAANLKTLKKYQNNEGCQNKGKVSK